MQSIKMKAVVYPEPFQYLHPLKSTPPTEVNWDLVARVQANARIIVGDLTLEQIVEIANALLGSLQTFYNDCEFLHWMGHSVPKGANYYDLLAQEGTPTLSDSPFSEIEIISDYCLERMALPYIDAKIFAVFALIKLDEMAERYQRFHSNPKNIVDLEMAGGALCEAMEALGTAYSTERFRRMHIALQESEVSTRAKMKKEIAMHAVAGKARKHDPFKEAVLNKYAAGKYKSPHDASTRIWEDARKNPQNYPDCHLVKSRGKGTVYDWIREAYPDHCKPRRQSTPA